jgi:hypothetical protein
VNIDIQLSKIEKISIDLRTLISLEYHDFLNVFFKQEADKLFSHRENHDHHIKLKEEKEKVDHEYASLYRMSDDELLLVKQYLEKHLQKNFIKSSSASYSSLILFVRKSDDELRFCVDYRKLNTITRKNRYWLSLIAEIIARLTKIKFITKINIRHTFNRIRMIIEKDEKLTIFITKYDNYQYRVLLFNLTNDSFTFQQFVNDSFLEWLNAFIIVYLDDLIIYNNNLKEHQEHVRKVLQRLREIELQTDIDKYEFHVFETKFLSMIIERDEIKMNSTKI